jgi:DNA invertase Pin-like site-specific DNA recombinase
MGEMMLMSSGQDAITSGLVTELATVAQAAGDRLRAETDGDARAAKAAGDALLAAATAAMAAGHSLSDITQAEAYGKEGVRDALRPDTLREVKRSGRRAREVKEEHHQAIARAMRLGLSTREIAAAARVAHGTVRAIMNRLSTTAADGSTHTDDQIDVEPRRRNSAGRKPTRM